MTDDQLTALMAAILLAGMWTNGDDMSTEDAVSTARMLLKKAQR
jgi:hypothetical protein